MDTPNIIDNIKNIVKQKLENAEAGHDWFHVERVYKMAVKIAGTESNIDMSVIEYAALLHDIADSKFHDGDETIGPALAKDILEELGVSIEKIEHTVKIIENISFKGGHSFSDFVSKELDIVRDADRAFNYGGYKGRKLYDPEISPNLNMTKEAYKNSTAPTINHFYEKLLLLKDKMKTKEGKRIAEERHAFLELYLSQFMSEVN